MIKKIKNLYTKKLRNGLQVIYYYEKGKNTFYVDASVNAGSIHEKPEEWGIAHYLEHVLLTSTKEFTKPKQLASFVNSIGASFNAGTSRTSVSVYGHFPVAEVENGIRMLNQYLFEPSFDQKIIDIQRDVIFDEILIDKDSKNSTLIKEVYKRRLCNQKEAKTFFPLGDEETLKKIDKKKLVAWHKRFYRPNNIILGGAGSVPPEKFFRLVAKYFAKHKKASLPPEIEVFRESNSPVLSTNESFAKSDTKFEKAYLVVSLPAFKINKEHHMLQPYYRILSEYMANNTGSKLFQELREKNGLVYNVNCSDYKTTNFSLWSVTTSFDIKHLEKITSIIAKELKKLKNKKINKKTLESVKEYVEKTYLMRYDDHENLLNWYLAEFYVNHLSEADLPVNTPEDFLDVYKQIEKNNFLNNIEPLLDFSYVNVFLYGNLGKKKNAELVKIIDELKNICSI